jgi:hemoglobin
MTSLYDHAGGEEKLHRLEDLFYSKVLADPVLRLLFIERRLKITDQQRERFVALYMEALDESGPPNDEPFRAAVRSHVEFGSQVAQQNSWAQTDNDLHPIRSVPRWQWPAISPRASHKVKSRAS